MSDIARLRAQIEAETLAMQQALNGYASTARHDIINARYRAMNDYHQQLIDAVGADKAGAILFAAYSNAMDDTP